MANVMKIHKIAVEIFLQNRNDKHNFCIEMGKKGNNAKYTTNERKWNLLHALQTYHEDNNGVF